jgi:hypothetical protein
MEDISFLFAAVMVIANLRKFVTVNIKQIFIQRQ